MRIHSDSPEAQVSHHLLFGVVEDQRRWRKGNCLNQDQKLGGKTSIPEPYWLMELILMNKLSKGLVAGSNRAGVRCSIWAQIPALPPGSSCCMASLRHRCQELLLKGM